MSQKSKVESRKAVGIPRSGGVGVGSTSIEEQIILAAIKAPPQTELELSSLTRGLTIQKMPTKTELLSAYHNLVRKKSIKRNEKLAKLLTRRGVRTMSGVTIITSLVKPYPCPGKCVYCPLDVRMPKSYLAEEPAAARALGLNFDPAEQMSRRIEALENNGHATDKIELIIKGGTWNAYPLTYQYWFILESFRAANLAAKPLPTLSSVEERDGDGDPSLLHKGENEKRGHSQRREQEERSSELTERSPLSTLKTALLHQQKLNERAKHRIIGLTLETRPDAISEKTLWQMRELGCTRLEIGVQHTDNETLKTIKRGHTIEQVKTATELAKNFGFKVDFHLMPQLPGATSETDLKMLEQVFTDPGLKPDMIKIYPCTVVKGSELYEWFQQGKYDAYPTSDLIDILKIFKSHVPRYVRISRLIRDIPGDQIENGNKITNLRQAIQQEMKNAGLACNCLRCREVGHVDIKTLKHESIKALKPVLFVEKYETNGGTEYFLSYEDQKRQVVFAFCRLRITNSSPNFSAKADPDGAISPASAGPRSAIGAISNFQSFIRELHTYGQMVRIGKEDKASSQHKGLGKKLMKEAEKIVKKNKINKLAIISGVGVRGYYRALGYRLEKTYMVKTITSN